MTTTRTSGQASARVDLHCHSTASQASKLGVQRSVGLPECATPPEEVYALAKRRGMDFVTITDHDTIDGALELAGRYDDVFLSEELTAWFRGEPQAVHVLVYGITPDDHGWLQAHRGDVEVCAAYLREQGITCALAHPFYAVEAPLAARHRRRLAELFPIWEVRNGSRAPELNAPAATYVDTHGGTGIGGSDDHAGVDIGRTWTETPAAESWRGFLDHLDAGRATARGEQGSAAKWAHAAIALAIRTLGEDDAEAGADPVAVLTMIDRLLAEGDVRTGVARGDLGPADAKRLLRGWLDAMDVGVTAAGLLAAMQADDFRHADLFRRARRTHEAKLGGAIDATLALAGAGGNPAMGALGIFDACLAVIPYAPAAAFLGREKRKLAPRDAQPLRVGLVADGLGAVHGVTRTIDQIRARGVPGFEVEVIGTDASVDRRLPAVREMEVPFSPGLRLGVPCLPSVVDVLAEGRYDVVHVCAPGPAGAAAAVLSRTMGLPLLGSYHTELAAYAGLLSGNPALEGLATRALRAFYGACDHVLSPSPQSDDALRGLGIPDARLGRWDRGVDLARFDPARRDPARFDPQRITVLYAGRLTREKGVDLLAEAFLAAAARHPRLHLCLAGRGPEEAALRERLGDRATFLGWLEGDALATAYASADLFLFASRTDTFGQVLLEAQASGLPVVAVDEGGPRSLVEDGRTGLLVAPRADALADAVGRLAAAPLLRTALGAGAREAVRSRTWDAALGRLGDGYHAALARDSIGRDAEVAEVA